MLLNVLLAVLVFIGVSAFQARNMLPTSGPLAPALHAATLGGGDYDLAGTGGRPVLIYFWAPWCKFCAASADNLVRLRHLRDESSLEILTVVLDWQNLAEVRDYVARHELNLPVLLGDGRVARAWHVQAFPTYYVLDSEHRIRRRDMGYSTQFGLWWRTFFL